MIRTALALGLAALALSSPPTGRADDRGDGGALPAGDLAVGTRAFRPATETYDPSHLVWARGTKLHDGDAVADLAPWRVVQIQRSPHGYFLMLSRSYRNGYRLAWYDGRGLTWLSGGYPMPEVSPDGRLAGWVDYDGPRIRHGRSARVVVADLVTGEVVFSTSRWMGDDTDLYGELDPHVVGFDEQYVYWERVTGKTDRVRTDLTTWETSRAATVDEYGLEIPVGLPLDTYTGSPVNLEDGRVTQDPNLGQPGFVSPDGRYAFNLGATARLAITDPATGARLDPEWDSRWRWFAGWQDADTAYIAIPRRYDGVYDDPPDRIPVRVAACDLPSGSCTTVLRTRGLHRMVFGSGGPEFL